MNIKHEDGEYSVESSSSKGKWYKVDPKKPWCDCPAYKFRYMKARKVCKHITAVREYIEKTQQATIGESQERADAVVAFVEEAGGEVDAMELIDKFGEANVDSLISQGALIEYKGRIKILK